jgi:hypothetical protein
LEYGDHCLHSVAKTDPGKTPILPSYNMEMLECLLEEFQWWSPLRRKMDGCGRGMGWKHTFPIPFAFGNAILCTCIFYLFDHT